MSRYIDADELLETIQQHDYLLATRNGSIDNGMFTIGIKQAVDEQPTADVAPVVHGHWIDLWGNHGVEFIGWRCTACGHIECGGADGANYCPNCGAKMNGGNTN